MDAAHQATGEFAHSPPVGIDLGTTYSVVAYVDATGHPITVPSSHGDLLTPSVVAIDDGIVIVGKEALKLASLQPDHVADCFKRDMGRSSFHRELIHTEVPPEVLSAFVLQRLKDDAERKLGPIRRVVITVPAFFDETRRRATQEAGRLAGLEVMDIINEPTAAAVAYGYQQSQSQRAGSTTMERVLVYDLGGGTFDVTVLEIREGTFRTVATDGDVELGGRDFDNRLFNHVADKFLDMHGVDPRTDLCDSAHLWADVQDAKHTLSERQRAIVVCTHAGIRMRVEITRSEFEELIQDLVDRTCTTAAQVVQDARLTWPEIDRVLLVGGSTRMPMVIDRLRQLTGKEPDRSMSADEAVAHGAAIYAQMLIKKTSTGPGGGSALINVNSHSLGLVGLDTVTKRKTNVILIPRNTSLPVRVSKKFRTARGNQRSVEVTIVEGESSEPNFCIQLGKCIIRDLPPNLPERTEIEVEYAYSANGRLSVYARVPSARVSASAVIRRDDDRHLDDLATWVARLSGTAPATGAAGPASVANREHLATDRVGMIEQLDELYARLGSKAARLTVPPQIKPSQQLALSAAKALQEAEAALNAPTLERTQARRVATSANARQTIDHAKSQAQFAYVVLGRECAKASFCPPDFVEEWDLIEALRKRLSG